jgi:pimeloyl-ACP methyl ester carboxylesterase
MMESTSQTLALDDGETTTVEQWGAQGPVILCVHGMTSSRKAWLRFARHYADRYRVIAYDQRGHGDSANVAGPMSLERGVRDLENLAAQTGADIMGHSWGGAVAIRGGRRLHSKYVIAIDPMIVQAGDDWYAEFIDDLSLQLETTGAQREAHLRAEYTTWSEDDVTGKIHALHAMTTAPIAALRDENRGPAWNLREDIANFENPLLLLIAGEQESIIPPDIMNDIRNHHGPQVQIVTFQKQGHNLHRTDFEGFADELDAFLNPTQL